MAEIMKKIEELMVNRGRAYIPSHYHLKLMKVAIPEKYENEFGEGEYMLVPGDPKLEGTRGEHWSPIWLKISKKYRLANGQPIGPDSIPFGVWIDIMTPESRIERENSVTWAIDAELVTDIPFKIGELTINPAVDMLCCGDENGKPNLEWGCWPVKKIIFVDTYEDK